MKFLLETLCSLLPLKRTVTVTLDVSDNDWETLKKVTKALKKLGSRSGGILELEIVGMNRMHPTAVLSIHDVLSRRPASVKLHVNVRTNLVDGSLIFPLLADKLDLRKGVWLQYAHPKELNKNAMPDDEDGEEWKGDAGNSLVNTVKEPAVVKDYRALTEMLGEYLPLAEFKGKRLPLHETLEEFGLLKNAARDAALARLFAP
jgi:hypothetical protein